MLHRIKHDTEWHDGANVIIVPAGELVDVVEIKAIPEDQGRRDISQGIAKYAIQKRDFVPIAIRDWFALIEVTSLELMTTGPAATLSPKARRKRTGVPGLPAAELAPCATT